MPQAATATHGTSDCRCLCGNLVARLVEDGVELKCRRCKRLVLVPVEGAPSPSRGTGARSPRFHESNPRPADPSPEPNPSRARDARDAGARRARCPGRSASFPVS